MERKPGQQPSEPKHLVRRPEGKRHNVGNAGPVEDFQDQSAYDADGYKTNPEKTARLSTVSGNYSE